MSFAKLNRSIWSIAYHKLGQSFKLDLFIEEGKEFVLKNCYTIVNINGVNFEEFTDKHKFIKPNDLRGKSLMDHCAQSLIEKFKPHILLSYGFSDQFCFVINKSTNFCERNLIEILSTIISNFTSNYVFSWTEYFGDNQSLQYAPSFKGSTFLIPNEENLIKYILTKQHECYILNLNNTLYSALIGKYRGYISDEDGFRLSDFKFKKIEDKKVTNEKALELIKTDINSISKINEYLFKEFNLNYNKEPELFRKGTLMHLDNLQNLKSFNRKLNEEILSAIFIYQENGKCRFPVKKLSNQSKNKIDCLTDYQLNQDNKLIKKLKSTQSTDKN